jgi:hypothetical protein
MARRFIAAVRGLKFGSGYLEIGDPIPRRKEDSLHGLVGRGWVKEVDESEIDPKKLAKVKAEEGETVVKEEPEAASPSFTDLENKTKAELIELLPGVGFTLETVEGTGSGGAVLKKDLIAALNSA